MKIIALILVLLFGAKAHAIKSQCFVDVYFNVEGSGARVDRISMDKLIKKSKPYSNTQWKLPEGKPVVAERINELGVTFATIHSSTQYTMTLASTANRLEVSSKDQIRKTSETIRGVMSVYLGESEPLIGDDYAFKLVCEIVSLN